MPSAGIAGDGAEIFLFSFQGNAENSPQLHLVGPQLQEKNQRTDSKNRIYYINLELAAGKISPGPRTKEQSDK